MFDQIFANQGILLAFVLVLGLLSALAWVSGRGNLNKSGQALAESERESSNRWANEKHLKKLGMIGDPKDPNPARIELGTMGKSTVVNGLYRSALMLAPTGAGKTPRFVVPTVLRHKGPALVASVKSDVLALTLSQREAQGSAWVFDPAGSPETTARWSPLASVETWADALNAATWLQEASAAESSGVENQQFWDSQAKRLLAPILLLVARSGGTMSDVFEIIANTAPREKELAERIAECDLMAASYWSLYMSLHEKTKTSVLATASDVLEAWSHPTMQHAVDVCAGDPHALDLKQLLDEGGTLYLVAPASVQRQFTPIYETLVNAVLMEIENRYHQTALPLPEPFLLMLDEAANIAPLRRLDVVASAMAGMGVITVTVWQNEGQMINTYGRDKARVVAANHTARLYMAGIADKDTLDGLSEMIGRDLVERSSRNRDTNGNSSVSGQVQEIVVAPPSMLREMNQSEAVVVAGNAKPMRLHLTGWFESTELRALVSPDAAAAMDRVYASGKKSSPSMLRKLVRA